MKAQQSYVPGFGLVTYTPGRPYKTLLVPDTSYSPVRVPAREIATPNTDAPGKTDWYRHGLLTVIALAAGCLIIDGLLLWLIAWWLS